VADGWKDKGKFVHVLNKVPRRENLFIA